MKKRELMILNSSTDNRNSVEKVSLKFYFLQGLYFLLYMVGGM
jgi:hypothetical protein